MAKGQAFEWTAELLGRVEAASGAENAALAEELGLAVNTIYSMRARIRREGIEGILSRQENRYQVRIQARVFETLGEQLGRIFNINVSNAGRGGQSAQFTVTIPSRVGEAWVAKWGRQVRFQPTEDGLLIVPVPTQEVGEIPEWLNGASPDREPE